MALKTQIKRIETARKKYKAEIAKLGRKAIAKGLGEVIPPGFAIAWTQYTPGFNDGDPCRFTIGGVKLCTIKEVAEVERVEAPEPEPSEETIEAATAEPDPITGEVVEPEDLEELPASTGQAETDEEVEVELGEDERQDWDEEDEGTTELEYGKASDLKWCGMTAKAFAAMRATWKMIDDEDLLEKAFGDGVRVIVRSGGKVTVEEYDCGY